MINMKNVINEHMVFICAVLKKHRRFTFWSLCLIISIIVSTQSVSAQSANISLKYSSTHLLNVLEDIKRQTDYTFFYNDDIDENTLITLDIISNDIEKIMSAVLKGTNYKFKIVDNRIALYINNASPSINNSPSRKKNISGMVLDEKGEPMIGVTILQKGTKDIGTITSIDGKYSIAIEGNRPVLQISYIGYETIEKTISQQDSYLVIEMRPTAIELESVVVVGYGSQKKINLTGAVSAVNVDEKMSVRSVPNVSSALSGMVPGLSAVQNSSMAGNNSAILKIRGLGTVNNSTPLIVVDGMPDVDINRIDIQDIESISVLKDAASSAIYGSRAANGVILVTTKTGKGKEPKINFSSVISFSEPTNSFDFMNDYPRAMLTHQIKERTVTYPNSLTFKDGSIDQWLALGMIDPILYPNTDWWDIILRTGITQKHNISASGNTERSDFYISAGIMDEKGLQIYNDYSRYNVRFNYNFKIRENINLGAKLDGSWSKMSYYLSDGFTDDSSSNTSGYDLFYSVAGIVPYDPESGKYGGAMAYGENPLVMNPLAMIKNRLKNTDRQEFNGSTYLEWKPIKGLTARIDYALNYYFRYLSQNYIPTGFAWNFQTNSGTSREYVASNEGVSVYTTNGYKTQLTARLDYNIQLGDHHNLNALAVYNEEYWFDRSLSATRKDRLHPSLTELDAALPDLSTNSGNSTSEGLRSFIGRINYAAYDKYLMEVNFRADGSSKFQKTGRFGFFPSIALGWRLSEEDFIKERTSSWLSNAKLRTSYGILGNNSGVARFQQQETLAAAFYIIDGGTVKGFTNTRMLNRDLTWEKTTALNVGLDLSFLNNKLSLETDYYNRLTTDMLRPSSMSILLTGSYSAPEKNIGNMRNQGVEMTLTWRDNITKDLNYFITLNGSYNKNTLEKWNEYLNRGSRFIGMPYNFVYAYQDNGIAQSWEQIYNSPPNSTAPGDLLLKDVNGDGRISDEDKVAYPNIQENTPTTSLSLSGGVNWRSFDFSVLLQGATGRKSFWLNNYNNVNYSEVRYALTWAHYNNAWLIENRDGGWPRLNGTSSFNRAESTFWLDDMSYLRIKNVQIGYNLTDKKLNRIGLNSIRLFLTGENLLTFTSYRGLDPEKEGAASDAYPISKNYSIGVRIGIK